MELIESYKMSDFAIRNSMLSVTANDNLVKLSFESEPTLTEIVRLVSRDMENAHDKLRGCDSINEARMYYDRYLEARDALNIMTEY